MKLVSSAERVEETSKLVADVTKRVEGLRAVLQLVIMSTRTVSMYAEANRGRIVLLVVVCRILILLRYVLRSLAEIMNPSSSVEFIDEYFVLYLLQQTVGTMNTIESQFLWGNGSRFLNAKVAKAVETTIKELLGKVVTAIIISKTSVHIKEITRQELKTLVLNQKVTRREKNPGICTMNLIMRDQEFRHYLLVVQSSWKKWLKSCEYVEALLSRNMVVRKKVS